MKVDEPDLGGTYTYADYYAWRWEEMVELIRGKIVKMSPAPGSRHQRVVMNLSGLLWSSFRGHRCQVFTAPFDVRLPLKRSDTNDQQIVNVVQPDICVVCDPEKIDERGCLGAPDWIIEVLSQSTSRKDLRDKFDLYEEAGVREYWVVHPQEGTILVYVLDKSGKYVGSAKPFVRGDVVRSGSTGIALSLDEIFSE